MQTHRRLFVAGSLLLVALAGLGLWVMLSSRYRAVPPPAPTRRVEPLVPTPLPASPSTSATAATSQPLPTASPKGSPAQISVSDRARIGVGFPSGAPGDYDWGGQLPGWYLNWGVREHPDRPDGIEFAQMVRLRQDKFSPSLPTIAAAARSNPGALWLIGNEPDVAWQDNATPEQYAASYQRVRQAIKEADPTARVAIGGVSQPTPLRFQYLDLILDAYRQQFGAPMPVDVWNVHAFILREEVDSWGVGVPPGMSVDRGQLFEIADHGDLETFRRQIVGFRRWMADHGLREEPLIISEYGLLMPESYGYPASRVADFLIDTFDYLLTARDPEIGMPGDDYRLVQAFCWFSVADDLYPTPNLFDPETGLRTEVGDALVSYLAGLRQVD